MTTGIIILAAGTSSRMGQSKQLLKLHGEPLLRTAVKNAILCDVEQTVVVLGANHVRHYEVIGDLPASIITNKNWKSGLGSSIKAGLNELLHLYPQSDRALLMVCDQPFVTPAFLMAMLRLKTDKTIVASRYANTLGVPVLFSEAHFRELLCLDDKEGAKGILMNNASLTEPLDLPMGEVDIDTPEDYIKLTSRKN